MNAEPELLLLCFLYMLAIETASHQILFGCSALSPFLEFSSTQGVVLRPCTLASTSSQECYDHQHELGTTEKPQSR